MFSSLRREQKEAIGLLQVGTFLEYFDLMLYVHMAVLLNDLFFPKTDPHTTALLTAFAFCSTYVLRPFGALLFGYIGDHIGRKTTVVMTTMMMAVSCVIMANLPTYSQIGITAAWIVTGCRIVQGLSSMGEMVGAEIYLVETTKLPHKYPIVACLRVSCAVGSMVALGIASLVTTSGLSWRLAFWIGACIALVGAVARTRLRETPEFADMKKRMAKAMENARHDGLEAAAELLKSTNPIWKEKVNKKTFFAYLLGEFTWPIWFYFCYIHCANLLKSNFGYSPEQIIHHNFILSIAQLLGAIFFVVLSNKMYPLKIVQIKTILFVPFVVICPYVLQHVTSPNELIWLQLYCLFFSLSIFPAYAIIYNYFPIFKRFTCTSLIYALSRAIAYLITSFGIVALTDLFGHYGLWFIMVPAVVCFIWAVQHFDKLERERNDYHPVNLAAAKLSFQKFQEEAAALRYNRLQEEKKYYPTQEKTPLP